MLVFPKDEKMVFSLPLEKLKRLKATFLAVAFLLLFLNHVLAQDLPIRFQNYTVEDGLSMGTISAFEQDHNGFIWIATAEGLHKFDGKQFTVYKHIDGDQNSLADSYITSLLNIGDQLYMGNNSGTIDILNVDNESIKRIKLQDLEPDFDSPISGLYLFNQQLLITTNSGGVYSYHSTRKQLRRLAFKQLNQQQNTLFYFTTKHNLIANGNALYSFSNTDTTLLVTLSETITSIAQFNNKFYLGTNNGLFTFDFATNSVDEVPLPPKRRLINRITHLNSTSNELWIGSKGGLLMLDTALRFNHFTADETQSKSLVSNNITALFSDNQGNKWIGTIAGISKYAPSVRHFGLLNEFWFANKRFNNNVYHVYEDKAGTIWLGTLSGGLVRLSNNRIDKIYPEVRDGKYVSKSVRCIYQDSKGTYWIGTRDEGLFTLNPKTETFELVANKQNGKLNNNVIRSIKEDAAGNLWIGTQLGLYRKTGSQFTFYRADNNINNNVIYQIEESPDRKHLILASFRGGLQLFNKTTETFKTLRHIKGDSLSLSNNNVMSLAWVNDDTLLVGTYGGGLNIYSLKEQSFKHFTEKQGLANNAVYGIVYTGKGNCWLSTNSGLVKYNLYTEAYQNFGTQHYLQSREFNEGAFLNSSNGTIYFGGINGLNFFNPKEQNFTSNPPSLLITHIEANATSNKNGSIRLSHLDSRIEIDFAALYYVNPEGVLYEYQLENYDNTWIKTSANRIVYPRLSPGSYTLYIKAANDLKTWQAETISLKIIVAPPFWQRWWFIAACIVALVALILLVIRVRTKAVERSYKLQLVDSELRALRSQMNPHFIFNSLNSIQYYILQKEPKQAYVYLSKFANLMRKILQNSRLKYISIKEEADWLNLYLELERMRMDDNLKFSINLNDIRDAENIFIPTMLLQPFVENSIVHGLLPKEGNRTLSITISLQNNTIYCEIEDNGIGRTASEKINKKRNKHESAGMDLTRKRLEILGKGKNNYAMEIIDLKQNEMATGTLVKLKIPIVTKDEYAS
jgi:ligand-binding sensor domain-containing protein